jgi:hypothetical protein
MCLWTLKPSLMIRLAQTVKRTRGRFCHCLGSPSRVNFVFMFLALHWYIRGDHASGLSWQLECEESHSGGWLGMLLLAFVTALGFPLRSSTERPCRGRGKHPFSSHTFKPVSTSLPRSGLFSIDWRQITKMLLVFTFKSLWFLPLHTEI